MGFPISSEIDDAAAGDLHEVAHASSGRGLANKIHIGLLVALSLANGEFNSGRRKLGCRSVSRTMWEDDQ